MENILKQVEVRIAKGSELGEIEYLQRVRYTRISLVFARLGEQTRLLSQR